MNSLPSNNRDTLSGADTAIMGHIQTIAPPPQTSRDNSVPILPPGREKGGIGWMWPLLVTLGIAGLGWYFWPRGEMSLSPNAPVVARPRTSRPPMPMPMGDGESARRQIR